MCGLLNHFARNNVLCEHAPVKSGRNADLTKFLKTLCSIALRKDSMIFLTKTCNCKLVVVLLV